MKKMLLVRRKGFNYYTDYTELYMHRAFQNYGYSVVRDKEKSDFSVTVYISETEKYMKMTSSFFDETDNEGIDTLCSLFREVFKSEVAMVDITGYEYGTSEVYEFMLSKSFSAYDEPSYLFNEPPKLRKSIYVIDFKTNHSNYMSFVNIGGKLLGINIIFDFHNFENVPDLILSDARVCYYKDKETVWNDICFERDNNIFKANADFITLDKGINPKSAIMRGKKRDNEERRLGFGLHVLPVSETDTVLKGTLVIMSDGKEIFRDDINSTY